MLDKRQDRRAERLTEVIAKYRMMDVEARIAILEQSRLTFIRRETVQGEFTK